MHITNRKCNGDSSTLSQTESVAKWKSPNFSAVFAYGLSPYLWICKCTSVSPVNPLVQIHVQYLVPQYRNFNYPVSEVKRAVLLFRSKESEAEKMGDDS